ncbi:MAG: hypothetical protein ABWY06_11570 [Pseudomonas sp.]|uniref:hypothetical protein n=1 Tax=Pseudomonas sp. TaxID=306 RepID=UPI00339712CD
MVKLSRIGFLLASLSACTHATDDGLTPTLRPLDLPAISALSVSQAAEKVDQGDEDCTGFEVSEADARQYFAGAQQIDHYDYRHIVDWSACQASGTLQFADGSQANWRLQRYRAGLLVYPDGSEKYLYCAQCSAPFQ